MQRVALPCEKTNTLLLLLSNCSKCVPSLSWQLLSFHSIRILRNGAQTKSDVSPHRSLEAAAVLAARRLAECLVRMRMRAAKVRVGMRSEAASLNARVDLMEYRAHKPLYQIEF